MKEESEIKSYIESRIENLRKALEWKEKECEGLRLCLAKNVSKRTVEEIACGWLESDINSIGRAVEEIRSLRDQIALLEYILKNGEKEDDCGE